MRPDTSRQHRYQAKLNAGWRALLTKQIKKRGLAGAMFWE
ncbi:hypothetical protein LTSEADE_2748 [Salmonella enterica subsp. enterica serovar Adelaide str. A4-669]|uniref:Uncharacterized protein n=1 Tax=Salmonella enterica subsp. enterica serovar Adelaide str. A4-669 TaxID=913063 RepID=A0A6C8GLN4_SALET|nr:hypothetical protein LTSEADE_2748 [Salmonella enterica subsp. enterica serovar Adelaide str. A4-669]